MAELMSSRHCLGGSNFHMQYTPKYRRDVFEKEEIREIIKMAFDEEARKMGIKIEVVEFGPDHVHLFISNCKDYAAATIAGKLKGFSSWFIRKNYSELLKGYGMGGSFWTDGYFYESIGRVTAETVKKYIENQQKKHWMHEVYEAAKDADGDTKHRQARLDGFGA
jgi:putative transposase